MFKLIHVSCYIPWEKELLDNNVADVAGKCVGPD